MAAKKIRKANPIAKRKRFGAPEAVSVKKNKPTSSSSSLFETLWSRRKFDILGKKQKGQGRRVGLSRSRAVEKRKETLLQEYKQRGKANAFLDHRFGEKDEALAEEDKAILRFQRERQVQLQKKSKYLLPDEDDDEVLTHGGTALSTLDDFKDDLSLEDTDEDQDLDDELVRKLHFGGTTPRGSNEEGEQGKRRKSKKEIMEEIIAKSKFYKSQKAKEKEEDSELKDLLDKEFTALTQSKALISLARPTKVNSFKSLLARASTPADIDAADQTNHVKEKPDDYDKLVKEMGMEIRAHASDRLKTAEEIAQDEKARLEELERNRKRRMLGELDSDESEEDVSDKGDKLTRQKKKQREISGDDLGDNLLWEAEKQERGWADDVLARQQDDDERNSDEDDNESEGSGVEEDDKNDSGEGEMFDDYGSDSTGQEWEETVEYSILPVGSPGIVTVVSDGKSREEKFDSSKQVKYMKQVKVMQDKLINEDIKESLPFVIEAPKTLQELKLLVDIRSVDELLIAIQRIRTCNAIGLAAENRRKMQIFYGVLLQYFATLGGETPCELDRVNALVKPLIEMSSETPYFAAVCARQWIGRMHHQLSEKLRNSDERSCWPSLKTLLLLRLWSMIFPPSDFRHVVMTPATLLMAEYLVRCPVNSGRDITVGIFLCALLLAVVRQGQRFCPEALCFLYAAILSALPRDKYSSETPGCPACMVELVASQPWLLVRGDCTADAQTNHLDFDYLMISNEASPYFNSDNFRVAAFRCVIETLQGFIHIYEDFPSFSEIFYPFFFILPKVAMFLPDAIKNSVLRMTENLKERIDKHESLRQPLRMRMKKPVPIKQFNPKFEENFVQGRDYDPDRERAERKKLQRQLKKEARGAARELRKDNYFLQEEKAKEKAVIEEEQAEKYSKAMAFLQEQETAFKSGQLGKRRRKR